jgi:hypothetical protein
MWLGRFCQRSIQRLVRVNGQWDQARSGANIIYSITIPIMDYAACHQLAEPARLIYAIIRIKLLFNY